MTRPEHLIRWWGPRSVPLIDIEMDLRPGGHYRLVSRAADGTIHPFKGEFLEIEPPGRLVMTQVYDVPPANEHQLVSTIELEERDGITHMTARSVFDAKEALDGYVASGMEWGMRETYERLDELVADADREIFTMRTFHAPVALVYEAFTDPVHLGEWWGPNGFRTTTYEHRVAPGGTWRFMMHGPDGTDYPNRVVYQDVVPRERLVWNHNADSDELHFTGTVTFTEVDATRTTVSLHLLAPSAAAMAEMRKFGAVEGAQQNLARFGEHLERRLSGDLRPAGQVG
jgi:uncharacterized protein YndB with AHSA1/START domain